MSEVFVFGRLGTEFQSWLYPARLPPPACSGKPVRYSVGGGKCIWSAQVFAAKVSFGIMEELHRSRRGTWWIRRPDASEWYKCTERDALLWLAFHRHVEPNPDVLIAFADAVGLARTRLSEAKAELCSSVELVWWGLALQQGRES